MSQHTAPPRELSSAFGAWLRATPADAAPVTLPSGISPLTHLGLPRLFTQRVVPSPAARQRWETERFVQFPARCTLCERAPERFSSLYRSRGLLRTAEPVLMSCIPQCAEHAAFGPLLWFGVTILGRDVAWELVGARPAFLVSTAELNAATERMPPWLAFPEYGPDAGGWRQGAGEFWRNTCWAPYWAALDPGARHAYLQRWPAPEGWRQALEAWPGWTPPA